MSAQPGSVSKQKQGRDWPRSKMTAGVSGEKAEKTEC